MKRKLEDLKRWKFLHISFELVYLRAFGAESSLDSNANVCVVAILFRIFIGGLFIFDIGIIPFFLLVVFQLNAFADFLWKERLLLRKVIKSSFDVIILNKSWKYPISVMITILIHSIDPSLIYHWLIFVQGSYISYLYKVRIRNYKSSQRPKIGIH